MPRKQKSVNIEVEATLDPAGPATENVKSDAEKTFEELVIDNENFVYSLVNKEFKNYSFEVKKDLYSARKSRISLCSN